MFFYWGKLGIKGLFYMSELTLASVFLAMLCSINVVIKYGTLVT